MAETTLMRMTLLCISAIIAMFEETQRGGVFCRLFSCVLFMNYAKPLAKLVTEFERLPGIGPKSAQRLAFHVLRMSEDEAKEFASAILEVKNKIRQCKVCFSYTDQEICDICSDPGRNQRIICVVSEPRDIVAMDKTNEYRGVYHVLGGGNISYGWYWAGKTAYKRTISSNTG